MKIAFEVTMRYTVECPPEMEQEARDRAKESLYRIKGLAAVGCRPVGGDMGVTVELAGWTEPEIVPDRPSPLTPE